MSATSSNDATEREEKGETASLETGPGADDAPELDPLPDGPPPLPAKKAADGPPEPLATTSHLPPRTWPPKALSDLMTRKIITVGEDEPVADLETWMARFRFHHLPVVTSEMKLVGLITRTDFLHAALDRSVKKDGGEQAPVASGIMRRNVVTGTPDTSLTMACRVMLQEQLGCLPVVLDDGTLVGIVTRGDVVRMAVELLERKA